MWFPDQIYEAQENDGNVSTKILSCIVYQIRERPEKVREIDKKDRLRIIGIDFSYFTIRICCCCSLFKTSIQTENKRKIFDLHILRVR